MGYLNKNYVVMTDERTGAAVIKIRGRATADMADTIEGDCTRRHQMVAIPHAAGAVLKSMDGTNPVVVSITVPITGRTYRCVKVDGRAIPFAPQQTTRDSAFVGNGIVAFEEIYKEVGGVA